MDRSKGGGDRVVDCIWKLYNMAFENSVVSQDRRSAVIIPLYKGKGKRRLNVGTIEVLAC